MDGVRAAAIFKQTAADGVAKPRRYGRGGVDRYYKSVVEAFVCVVVV